MRWGAIFVAVLMLVASGARAEAPSHTPRPPPRPTAAVAGPVLPVLPVIRPLPRPVGLAVAVPQPPVAALPVIRPKARPKGLAQVAVVPEAETAAVVPQGKPAREKRSKKGSVCGDPAIKGVKLARISSRVKGCGVAEPVQVTAVDGVRLNPPATLDCDTARALRAWVDKGMRPAFKGREVVELRIAAHYICRPRNNVKGNRISEHGHGKAIDIAGFVFSDGKEWTVLGNYNKEIRRAHKAACGIFGTTLGPGSDGYHENHLHFDTASYRGGPYCR
jgi:hypothetical protein